MEQSPYMPPLVKEESSRSVGPRLKAEASKASVTSRASRSLSPKPALPGVGVGRGGPQMLQDLAEHYQGLDAQLATSRAELVQVGRGKGTWREEGVERTSITRERERERETKQPFSPGRALPQPREQRAGAIERIGPPIHTPPPHENGNGVVGGLAFAFAPARALGVCGSGGPRLPAPCAAIWGWLDGGRWAPIQATPPALVPLPPLPPCAARRAPPSCLVSRLSQSVAN